MMCTKYFIEPITKLVSALKPRRFKLPQGSFVIIGSTKKRQQLLTLFSKLSQVYELATANRPLCQHEVMILSVRCYSLGCFFPVRFPSASVKPKLHLLAHRFPQKAHHQGSVGIETEQLAESMHPCVNRRNRQYACVRNPLVARSQWLASRLLSLRKSVQHLTSRITMCKYHCLVL